MTFSVRQGYRTVAAEFHPEFEFFEINDPVVSKTVFGVMVMLI